MSRDPQRQELPGMVNEKTTCDVCGAPGVRKASEVQTFRYGSEEDAVDLTVVVPVYFCRACDVKYTDHEAERLRHEAVCEHRRVLTPAQIIHLRKKQYNLSREDFADLTGIGVASLARWESGALIQTEAHDRYLRLLAHPEVFNRLRVLALSLDKIDVGQSNMECYFPSLERTPEIEARGRRFQLQIG